ncbi:MAG: CDP-diacylglycerol--glycerol-3-phosphate 3-phosphatidyltransferase [Elusimicrobiota bacterium]
MNLANKLTLLRIALVPVLVMFMYVNNFWTRIFALVIFILAAVTDIYDGFFARKYKTITTLGIFLDPIADKLIISAAFITFVGLKELRIPAWMVILIITREFIITGLRSLAASKNIVIPAKKSGKFKTTSQIISIIALLLILIVNSALWRYYRIVPSELLYSAETMKYALGWILVKLPFWLMLITTTLTVISGATYLKEHKDLLRE